MWSVIIAGLSLALSAINLIMIHRGNLRMRAAETRLRAAIEFTVRDIERRRFS